MLGFLLGVLCFGLHLLCGVDASIHALDEVAERLLRSLHGLYIIRLGSVEYGLEHVHGRWLLPRLAMKGYGSVEGEEGRQLDLYKQ